MPVVREKGAVSLVSIVSPDSAPVTCGSHRLSSHASAEGEGVTTVSEDHETQAVRSDLDELKTLLDFEPEAGSLR